VTRGVDAGTEATRAINASSEKQLFLSVLSQGRLSGQSDLLSDLDRGAHGANTGM
jgi:hypothetical protein